MNFNFNFVYFNYNMNYNFNFVYFKSIQIYINLQGMQKYRKCFICI